MQTASCILFLGESDQTINIPSLSSWAFDASKRLTLTLGRILLNAADTAWILTATALVLLMTLPGLGLFYAGLVQAKNALSVLMHCIAIACLASILWFVVGYSIAFSGDGAWLGNLDRVLLAGIDRETLSGTLPESLFAMFQMTFAIITPALMVGAFVERIKFGAVMMISGLWLLIVYAPTVHWVWGGGWLAEMGVIDFAGGIVVHVTAGVSAAVIAVMPVSYTHLTLPTKA